MAWCTLGLIVLAPVGCGGESPRGAPPDARVSDARVDRADGAPPIDDDGSVPLPDGGADPDGGPPPVSCASDWDCEDFDACTSDTCMAGTCDNSWIDGCEGCRSDAECDDGNPGTKDVCDTFDRWCHHFPGPFCSSPADCDDGDACTVDQCNDSGLCAWGSDPDCCHRATDCEDFDSCTTDRCDAATCAHDPVPGCTTGCPDSDRDGASASWCGGSDCDDFDSRRSPSTTEVCDDVVDNDCDGLVDRVDDACGPANRTCATAIPVASGAHVMGTTISMSGTTGSCGGSAFYTLTLAETSDVTLDLTIHMPPPPPPPCPTCPPPSGMHTYNFRVFLERVCGDTSTDVNGGGTWCRFWSPTGGPFPGSSSDRLQARRIPAGTYTIEVQAGEMFAWMATAIDFDLDVTVRASAAPACTTATPIVEGATTTGSTSGAPDAFGYECDGRTIVETPETIHFFDLSSERRVRIEATGVAPAGAMPPALRVGLLGTCDATAARLECMETIGGTCMPSGMIETILPAGRYYAYVEAESFGTVSYELRMTTEASGAACSGAATIAASGAYSGTTAGAVDRFRDNEVCGDGAGPDVVYALTVAVRTRVVLDLVASYTGPQLMLLDACGGSLVAGGGRSTRVDRELAPGTYYAVVGGQQSTSAGPYVLNATLLAVSP